MILSGHELNFRCRFGTFALEKPTTTTTIHNHNHNESLVVKMGGVRAYYGCNGSLYHHYHHQKQSNWTRQRSMVHLSHTPLDPVRGGGFLTTVPLPNNKRRRRRRRKLVADLGCGAGNLSLPLAWWFRDKGYGVLGVDMNGVSLDRLVQRARSGASGLVVGRCSEGDIVSSVCMADFQIVIVR